MAKKAAVPVTDTGPSSLALRRKRAAANAEKAGKAKDAKGKTDDNLTHDDNSAHSNHQQQKKNKTQKSVPQVSPSITVVQSPNSLSDFGLTAIKKNSHGYFGTSKQCQLKCCVVRGENNESYCIVWKVDAINSELQNANWAEKVLLEAIKNPSSWAAKFNFEPDTRDWVHNDTIMYVSTHNRFKIRLFMMTVMEKPAMKQLVGLGSMIAYNVTNTKDNYCPLFFNENNFLWLKNDVVWSDIIGTMAGKQMIRAEKGEPVPGKSHAFLNASLLLHSTHNLLIPFHSFRVF